MTISEYISGRLSDAVVSIQTNLEARKINASGRTSASIHVNEVEQGKRWQIVGGGQNCAPIATLEVGRGGGGIPMGFADILQQWAADKGFALDDKGARALAWKIKRQGTERHYAPEDVYSTVITTTEADIRAEVSSAASAEIKSMIHNAIHDIFG